MLLLNVNVSCAWTLMAQKVPLLVLNQDIDSLLERRGHKLLP